LSGQFFFISHFHFEPNLINYGVLSSSEPVAKPHLAAAKQGLTPGPDSLISLILCRLDLGQFLS
jgi:hypothetical protein